jgi:hypothetical protein
VSCWDIVEVETSRLWIACAAGHQRLEQDVAVLHQA